VAAVATPAQFALPFSHYARLGYLPVAVRGKEAFVKDWPNKRYSEEELQGLDAASDLNVGLLCENIVGLDIDLTDERHAKAIEALIRRTLKLPKTTPRRVGRAPKCLLVMRVERPLPSFDLKHAKTTTLFQLLGAGRQFVVHGIHPDTGQPYTLNRPLPKVEALPLLTPEGLVALRVAVAEGLAHLGYDIAATGTGSGAKADSWSEPHPWSLVGTVQASMALSGLDPNMCRSDWIKVGMAIADGTHGSEDGFSMWEVWSRGSPKFKQREMRKQWKSFKPGSITKATLFKNDFLKRKPVDSPPPPQSEEPDDTVEALRRTKPGAVPWLVDGLMTHGAHLLVGRPKGGKSWVTMDMAYAVANAGSFAGKKARAGRVLWFAAEDTREGLARRLDVRGEDGGDNIVVYTMERLRKERKQWTDATTFHEMLDARLTEDHFDLVIVDTQKTCEAVWASEQIDVKRSASVVDIAYQSVRLYDEIGQERKTCIVLVHHTGKQKNNRGNDYHERINMPATVVAGVTGSLVLADPPERELHDKDDFQRVLAVRGRHMAQGDEQLMIALKMGRVELLGEYIEVVQTRAQIEVFEAIEALLKDHAVTSIAQIAEALGKHRNTVQRALARAAREPGGMVWKGRRLDIRSKLGIRWLT
jgi:hypothetical protein